MSDEVVPDGQRSKVVKRLQKENKVLRDKLDEIIRQNEARELYMAPTTSDPGEAAPVAPATPAVNNKKPEAHVKPLKPEPAAKPVDDVQLQRCELNEAKEKIKVLETWLQEQLTCFSDKENKLRAVILEKEREIGFLTSELENRKAEAEEGNEACAEKERLKKNLTKEMSERVAAEAAVKTKDAELKKAFDQVKEPMSGKSSSTEQHLQWREERQDYERRLEEMTSSCNKLREKLDKAHDYMESERVRAEESTARVLELEDEIELLNEKIVDESAERAREKEVLEEQVELLNQKLKEFSANAVGKQEFEDQIQLLLKKQLEKESSARELEKQNLEEVKEFYAKHLKECLARAEQITLREIEENHLNVEMVTAELNKESAIRYREGMRWDAAKEDYERRLEEMRVRAEESTARVLELEGQLELQNEKIAVVSADRLMEKEEFEEQIQLLKQQLEEETRARELEKQKLEKRLKAKADSCARAMQQELWEAEYARCLEELMTSTDKLYKRLDEQQASMESERVRAEQATRRIKELEDEIESLCGKLDGESSARTRDQMVWETEKEDYDRRLEEMMRKEEAMSELLSHGSNSNNVLVDAVTSTEDEEDLFEENVERRSNSEGNWQQRGEYRPQGTVLPFSSFEFFDFDERWRGPFGVRQMQEWYRKGYFPGDLEIRIDGTKLFVYTVAQLIARNGRECPFVFLK